MIYAERIRFRAPERDDLSLFISWLNDPEVRAGLLMHLPFSMADEEQWFEGVLKRPPHEHPFVIEVHQAEDWKALGTCGFHNLDWRIRSAEVGIMIGEKSYWNRGYGTETMRLLLKHGFETLNLNRIYLDVYQNNPRAVRTYEKAGFVHEGTKRQAAFKNGQYIDVLLMSVLKSEWQE